MTRHTPLHVSIVDSSLGPVLVAETDRGIRAVLMGENREAVRAELATRFPRASFVEDDPAFPSQASEVLALIESPLHSADRLRTDLAGTAFQREVWEALRAIPAGTTATYRDIARLIRRPGASRAVGQACAANPVAVLVPCHRAVGTDGGLTGYRWGIERKRALLARENTGGAHGRAPHR